MDFDFVWNRTITLSINILKSRYTVVCSDKQYRKQHYFGPERVPATKNSFNKMLTSTISTTDYLSQKETYYVTRKICRLIVFMWIYLYKRSTLQKRYFQANKKFCRFLSLGPTSIQYLKVSLKLNPKEMSYHFTCIVFMKVTNFCSENGLFRTVIENELFINFKI